MVHKIIKNISLDNSPDSDEVFIRTIKTIRIITMTINFVLKFG